MDCGSVVCAPFGHYIVHICECSLASETRSEPGCRPSRVGTFVKHIVDFVWKIARITFCYLEDRADSVNYIETNHCDRHFCFGAEMGRESAATEIFIISTAPISCIEAIFDVLVCHIPPLFLYSIAICILYCTGAIKGGGTRVDEMDDPILCTACKFVSCYALNSFRAPICPNVVEARSLASEQCGHKHRHTVASIIFSSESHWTLFTIPVE